MPTFLEKIFPPKHKKFFEEDAKSLAERGKVKDREALALDERTSQELLYYLADKDPSNKVRKAVAANPSTPYQAAPILARDQSEDVRIVLARRLVKVLPSLSEDKYGQLYAFAVQALGMLALDEVLKIRKVLTETLKDSSHTPPAVAAQLARDLEREVSEPILRFCVALSDDDLVDILKTHPANWAVEAIAQRKVLSARVSEAVIDTGNVRAGQLLLSNNGADITVILLEKIVERAREYPEWHKPLVTRKALPPLMVRKLAAYVDKTVHKMLTERSDLDSETIAEIKDVIQRRMEYEDNRKKSVDRTNPVIRAQKMFAAGDITEEIVADAIALRDRDFAVACLALMAHTTIDNIQKVFDARAPKSICAICWKCGFSMRLSLKLQQYFGQIRPADLIYARGGTDYPMTEEELKWQLGVIGIG